MHARIKTLTEAERAGEPAEKLKQLYRAIEDDERRLSVLKSVAR